MMNNQFRRSFKATGIAAVALSAIFASSMSDAAKAADEKTNFFLTSVGAGDGANLGGLEGADRHCGKLAEAAGLTAKTWRAYLSTFGPDAINARDRIGAGPWYNAKGELVARDIDHLHSEDSGLGKEGSLTERGEVVNGRGDKPNRHDILTGSQANGMAISGLNMTCGNWTSNSDSDYAQVGHHDRIGGGPNPKQWNSAHPTKGCSQKALQSTGGDGLFYCFAVKN